MGRRVVADWRSFIADVREGTVTALIEASDLIFRLGADARTPKERRLRAWRKVAQHFSLNRIAEIDRRSDRVVVTADELNALKSAAGISENSLERQLADALARVADLEKQIVEVAALLRGRDAEGGGMGGLGAR